MDNERPKQQGNEDVLRKGCEEPVLRERRGVEERPTPRDSSAPQTQDKGSESRQ